MAEISLSKGRDQVICSRNLYEMRQKGTQSTLTIHQRAEHKLKTNVLIYVRGQTNIASDEAYSGLGTGKVNLQKITAPPHL